MPIQNSTRDTLRGLYHAYIDCLNRQDWHHLGEFVADTAIHNGRPLGLDGYRRMLINDFEEIPDLSFKIALLVVDPPYVVCRLVFTCSPKGEFLGLAVNGRKVSFTEVAIYEYREGKIGEVWSVIDKQAIETQLA